MSLVTIVRGALKRLGIKASAGDLARGRVVRVSLPREKNSLVVGINSAKPTPNRALLFGLILSQDLPPEKTLSRAGQSRRGFHETLARISRVCCRMCFGPVPSHDYVAPVNGDVAEAGSNDMRCLYAGHSFCHCLLCPAEYFRWFSCTVLLRGRRNESRENRAGRCFMSCIG